MEKRETMKDIHFEFEELESVNSFELLGKHFGAVVQNDTLLFDNPVARGELVKRSPEAGLWLRKWKLTVLQKITLHRLAAAEVAEQKFTLLYFLNPSIFDLRENAKRVNLSSQRNNLFMSNEVPMDFTVLPKQPFYAADITFTASWLQTQFDEEDPCFREILQPYLKRDTKKVLMVACDPDDYKILHELDQGLLTDNEDTLFIRSRVYRLVCNFFRKIMDAGDNATLRQKPCYYEQMIVAEAMLTKDLQKPPQVDVIAKEINMSPSSLLRHFKLMYGKNLYDHYIDKKMQYAKKMILEKRISVRDLAQTLGYKQSSPFIAMFTKHFGYSPGMLKANGLSFKV